MVQEAHDQHVRPPRRRVRHAGFLMGAGAAALAEGIVLHRLAGVHSFAGGDTFGSGFAEGLYDFAALGMLLYGVLLLYFARRRLTEPAAGRVLVGSGLVGAGLFLALEGVALHHLLGWHHVAETGNVAAWDVAYLVFAAVLAGVGRRLMTTAEWLRDTGTTKNRLRAHGRHP